MAAMDESLFDRIADKELHALEGALSELDPDECEVDNASGVLTLSLAGGSKLVVNSHRAARQIWLAAYLPGVRRAWHFSPVEEAPHWRWRTAPSADGSDELRATLESLLAGALGRPVPLPG